MPVTREQVYQALTIEDNYAKGWGVGKESKVEGIEPHLVSRRTGLPFTEMEWLTFVDLYLNEAKQGYANYVPDIRAVQIRLLKAASLLVSALQTSCTPEQLATIAGTSRTDFPTYKGGLKEFKAMGSKGDVA